MNPLLTLIGAFLTASVFFILGLFAWRQQLLDKRRFEIAEQVLVVFAKLSAHIETMRKRNDWDGFREFVEGKKIDSGSESHAYDWHIARREWMYRIPPDVAEDTKEIFAELPPTLALAKLYVPRAGYPLVTLNSIRRRIEEAATVLPTIDPEPTIDPLARPEPVPEFYRDDSDDLPMEEQVWLERKHLPVRFPLDVDDDIDNLLVDAQKNIEEACRVYSIQSPYRFLLRFVISLEPIWITRPHYAVRAFKRARQERVRDAKARADIEAWMKKYRTSPEQRSGSPPASEDNPEQPPEDRKPDAHQ